MVAAAAIAGSAGFSGTARAEDRGFHEVAAQAPGLQARNIVPYGHSPYFFPLIPGHKHILELKEETGERYRTETEVLDQIEVFDVGGIGLFATAVVREEEFATDELLFRVDRWIAIDGATRNVHVFGEVSWAISGKGHARLDDYWRAGETIEGRVSQPALLMPASITALSRLSLKSDVDVAEAIVDVVATGIQITVPAGRFAECVQLRKEQLPGKKGANESIWCPQVGLVSDSSSGQLISSTHAQ